MGSEREQIAALIVAGKNLRQYWADSGDYLSMDASTMAMKAKEMRRRSDETKKEFLDALEQVEQQKATPPDEDWFEEIISDTLDMDWRPRYAASAIVRRWDERWYPDHLPTERTDNGGQHE